MWHYKILFSHLPITFWGSYHLLFVSNAFVTGAADISFIGTAHAYLLNTSMTVRIYSNPLLKEEKACMSTKSADRISSLLKTITDRLGNSLLIGFLFSSANFFFQLQVLKVHLILPFPCFSFYCCYFRHQSNQSNQ